MQTMACRKTVSLFWTISPIAFVFFSSLATAIPSFSINPEENSSTPQPMQLTPAQPPALSPVYPPEMSPPSWPIVSPPHQQSSPISASPAMPSYMPPLLSTPFLLPPSLSPMPSAVPPSLPPMPSSPPPTLPPMPSYAPPTLPPMPSSAPPTLPPMPYPVPPAPSPMPYPMPPAPSPMPYPMHPPPSNPSPMPSSPPPMPIPVAPSPSMPYPMPPSPSSPSSTPPPMPAPMPPSRGIKGGYWPSWLAEKVPPLTIPTTYFTHLFYAFVSPDASTYKLSITQHDDQWMTNFTAALHAQNPPLKAFLSIGGGLSNPDIFSNMTSNSKNRATFIRSTIQVARKYGFDGLDLDWEFPNTPGDMSNLALLFKEWRESVEYESKFYGKPRLLLSAAVYFSPDFFLSGVPRSYPGVAIRSYVDFVNTLNFDYHGSWDTSVTGEHALLYDNSSRISTSYGMDAWPVAGVPPEKLVMGLPLYGRTWKLKNPRKHGIGAPAVGVGPGNNGIMFYNDIVDFNLANGATVVYENDSVSTYSYKGTDWIGYDGPASISRKIEYAKYMDLGGYFFWALGHDKDWTLSGLASIKWDS